MTFKLASFGRKDRWGDSSAWFLGTDFPGFPGHWTLSDQMGQSQANQMVVTLPVLDRVVAGAESCWFRFSPWEWLSLWRQRRYLLNAYSFSPGTQKIPS